MTSAGDVARSNSARHPARYWNDVLRIGDVTISNNWVVGDGVEARAATSPVGVHGAPGKAQRLRLYEPDLGASRDQGAASGVYRGTGSVTVLHRKLGL